MYFKKGGTIMRKSMKKAAALALTLAMSTALLAGCGSKDKSTGSKSSR